MEAPRRAAPAAFSLAIALSVLAASALSADTKPPEEEFFSIHRRCVPEHRQGGGLGPSCRFRGMAGATL